MFKVGTFLVHQPPDPGTAKRLLSRIWQKGREVFDGTLRRSGRVDKGWEVIKVEPNVVCVGSRSVVGVLNKPHIWQKFSTGWQNVANSYLSRNVTNGFASKVKKVGVFDVLIAGAGRPRTRYDGLAQKVIAYGFVGIGIAAGSNGSLVEDCAAVESVCEQLRDMFDDTGKCNAFGDSAEIAIMKKEDVEFGSLITHGLCMAVFKAKVKDFFVRDERTFTNEVVDGKSDKIDNVDPAEHYSEQLGRAQQAVLLGPTENEVCENYAATSECSQQVLGSVEDVTSDDDDTSLIVEDFVNHAMNTVIEQRQQLVDLHHIIGNQAIALRSLLGAKYVINAANLSAEQNVNSLCQSQMLNTVQGVTSSHSEKVDELSDGFVTIYDEFSLLSSEMHFPTAEQPLDEVDDPGGYSLTSLSASLTEIDEALRLVEEQHNQLMGMYQILHSQNIQLRSLLAEQQFEEISSDTPDNQTEHGSILPVSGSKDDIIVKIQPLLNCSSEYANRMLKKELLAMPCKDPKRNGTSYKLPAHSNIMKVYGGFVVSLRDTEILNVSSQACLTCFSDNDIYRGFTTCLVMKSYEFTLAQFLASHDPGIFESSLLLLQLVEAISHLVKNHICHRNITSASVFIEIVGGVPHLMLGDFGQSLCGSAVFGLRIPLLSEEQFRGGDFLSPEIVNAQPFSLLDYTKSDLWAAGVISYEIFGAPNPFTELCAATYAEQCLPDLPSTAPQCLNNLVKKILIKNPNARPEVLDVANVLHLILWGPKEWITSLKLDACPPSLHDMRRWLVQFAASTHCMNNFEGQTRQYIQSKTVVDLRKLFLSRIDSLQIKSSLQLLSSLFYSK